MSEANFYTRKVTNFSDGNTSPSPKNQSSSKSVENMYLNPKIILVETSQKVYRRLRRFGKKIYLI